MAIARVTLSMLVCPMRLTYKSDSRLFDRSGVRSISRGILSVAIVAAGLSAYGVSAPVPVAATPLIQVGFGFDGTVKTVAAGPDGTTYVGGDFTRYGAFTGSSALFSQSSAAVNTAFPSVTGEVLAVETDGSGGWFLGGTFTAVGGQARNGIAHVDSTGAITSFGIGSGPGTTVRALELVGSRLYVGYDTTSERGTFHFVGAVNKTTGASVVTLPSVNGSVRAIAATVTDLFIGGSFTSIDGTPATTKVGLARFDADTGVLDPVWRADVSGGAASVYALAIDSLGLIAGGDFTGVTNTTLAPRANLVRLTSATGVVQTWNYPTNGAVRAIAPVGTISGVGTSGVVIGGDFTSVGAGDDVRTRNKLALVWDEGISVWDPQIVGTTVNGLAFDGTIGYAVGDFTAAGGVTQSDAVAFNSASGVIEVIPWSPGLSQQGSAGDPKVNAVAVSGESVLMGGTFTMANTQTRNRAAAVASDGTLVSNWNPDLPSGSVNVITVDSDYVYVGGAFTLVSGGSVTRGFIARYSTAGVLDSSWNPNANGPVEAIAHFAGYTYVGGSFSNIGGQARTYVAKLDGSGNASSGWVPPAPDSPVLALAVDQTLSRLVIGGAFENIGSTPQGRVAALSLSTGALQPWNPNFNGTVQAITVTGKATYYAGVFTTVSGIPTANFVARFYGQTFDTDFTPNPNGPVETIAVKNGTVVLGGTFSTIGGSSRPFIGAVDSNGAFISTWIPTVNAPVLALAILPTGTVVAGGTFTESSQSGLSSGTGAAFFTAPPQAGPLTATPLAFSDVTVGTTGRLDITVTNTGSLSATLNSLVVTAIDEQTSSCTTPSLVLPANGSCTLTVTWTPLEAQTLTSAAAVIFEYAGGTASEFFSVTGRAINPPTPGGGGSGGGGGTPVTPSVNTSTTETATSSQSFGPDTSLTLRPGEVAIVSNGTRLPALGTPGVGNRSLVVTGGGMSLTVPSPTGLGGSGAPLWEPSQTANLNTAGFSPETVTNAFLLSTPTLVGSSNAAKPNEVAVSVPTTLQTGAHTLQVVGKDTQGRSLIIAVGLNVEKTPKSVGTSVYFKLSSAQLTKSAKATLRSMVKQVSAQSSSNPSARVVGVVRASGTRTSDIRLAKERARSVSQYMRSLGYQGSLRASTAKSPGADRWTDRRVNVSVTWSR